MTRVFSIGVAPTENLISPAAQTLLFSAATKRPITAHIAREMLFLLKDEPLPCSTYHQSYEAGESNEIFFWNQNHNLSIGL